jgi:hypothetical protein
MTGPNPFRLMARLSPFHARSVVLTGGRLPVENETARIGHPKRGTRGIPTEQSDGLKPLASSVASEGVFPLLSNLGERGLVAKPDPLSRPLQEHET